MRPSAVFLKTGGVILSEAKNLHSLSVSYRRTGLLAERFFMRDALRKTAGRNWLIVALVVGISFSTLAGLAADLEKAKAAYRRGNGLFDLDRFAEAVTAYNAAIAEDPQFAQAYHNLALADEMVDRKQAIEAWKRFIAVASSRPDLKFDVGRASARLQLLESMSPLPEAMQPSHYVSGAGDYYLLISGNSEGEEWARLPVKVYLGSAPDIKWQQGAREAYDVWAALFPMTLVSISQDADIRVSWVENEFREAEIGEEMEWVQIKQVGGELKARRVAVISADLSRRWSKDDMRAIMAHEFGHALGIKGHSDSKGDIMFWQKQEQRHQLNVPGFPLPIFWRSLVKQPSQRDINTLIRLYNHAGTSVRFP